VKIGLVDPKIALLNGSLKRKKLAQAKHISRGALARGAGMPRGLNMRPECIFTAL